MKARWKVLIAVVLVLGVIVVVPMVSHYRAKAALRAYRAQLVAQGEKLTVAENAPKGTDAERRAAQDYLSAIGPLGLQPKYYLPFMESVAPGRALVASAEEALPTEESSNVWPRMIREVSDHEEEFAKVRAALTNSGFDFNLDYNQGPWLSLPPLSRIRATTIWLSTATLVALHEHKYTEALENLHACLATTRLLERSKVEVCQGIRMAISSLSLSATWELLQYSQWQDGQLDDLQTTWETINFLPGAQAAFEMERASVPILYDLGRADFKNFYTPWMAASGPPANNVLSDFLSDPKKGYEQFMYRYPNYWAWKSHWSYDEELLNLQSVETALETLRVFQTNKAFAPTMQTFETNLSNLRNAYSEASEHFRFGLNEKFPSSYVLKFADTEMERQIVITAIALKRYQIRTGKYPSSLNDLVPEYLHEVPLDVMDGKPLRYHPNPDVTFLLYSVGEDGVDDGGDASPLQASSTSQSWWKGRDAVWPMPAGTNEVAIYKQKMMAVWTAKESAGKGFHSRRRLGSFPLPTK